ncbi:MAG TPA: flagellin [Anaeromyxobacteraceae bacterium]|nr:flagellin [Anaeromyxobacteraceae bacterium]
MSLSIRTNVASLNAQANLNNTQNSLDQSIQQLSSGYRINSPGDDAAGLAISTNLSAQIASYNQATSNANDGLSVIQTAEAGLSDATSILTRLRELAMQSASDGVGASERGYIQTEADALTAELQRVSQVTVYDGTSLLNGVTATLNFQVGIGATTADSISFTTLDATASTLLSSVGNASATTIFLTTAAQATAALAVIDAAIGQISTENATLGAAGNRFQDTISQISAMSQALSAANSRIMDVNVAQATSNLSQEQVLAQAGVSVLAQANQMPQLALKLLQ